MREPVVDFLNHGLLPFVGREKEMERILNFWRGSAESGGLRAFLLTGEAGAGKSRLIEEVIPAIESESGVVVHTKLRADSAISLAPLLSLALWSSPSAAPLLREEPEPSLSSIIGAVRRLCRLRRTILIIEDANLLEGVAVREFNLFVEALADESLALLLVSRPAELTARGAIEAYLVEELPLVLFESSDMQELWSRLFGNAGNADAIEALQHATLGNPLAFRSALRGAINAGILMQEADGWRIVVAQSAFREMATRSAYRLTEGMASHLTDEERDAARRLAPLGEVFAPEAAELLVVDAERLISLLLFKGILVRANTAATSLRDANVRGLPLIFAHSLLHRTLLEQSDVDADSLLKVIATDIPLYSVTPFFFIEEHPPENALPVDFMLEVIEKGQMIANRIDRTADWRLALRVWSIVEKIAERAIEADPTHRDVERLQLTMLVHHTNLLSRNDESDEYHNRAQSLLERTKEAEEKGIEWMIVLRIRAHTHLFRFRSRRDRNRCQDVIESVEKIVEGFPQLRLHPAYRSFLRVVSSCAYIFGFYLNDLRYVERAYRRVAEQSGDDPELRRHWLHDFGYYLISAFTTLEELEEKLALLTDLHRARVDRPYYYIREISFRIETGWYAHALELIEKYRPTLRDVGLERTVYSCILYECEILVNVGAPIESALTKGLELINNATGPANDLRRNHLARHFIAGVLMRGTISDVEKISSTLEFPEEGYPVTARILLALPSLETLRNVELIKPASGPGSEDLDDPDTDLENLVPAAHALLADTSPDATILGKLCDFFEESILRRYRILSLHTALSLVRALEEKGLILADDALLTAMRAGLRNALTWLAERRLPMHGGTLLAAHGDRLEEGERKEWLERFEIVEGEGTSTVEENASLSITMFGAITFRRPGGEIERIRGARNHLMLGLLVADRMLKKSLTRNAFIAMASGVEDDPERARRTMNMAVLRLREATSQEIVLTDQETPRLNAERVTVDLIEARRALTNADRLTRKRKLTQAIEELRIVFRLSGGDVPFPGLYEELFDNLRREFEDDLLAVTTMVGRQLIAERDYEHAEDILSQAIEIVPESEELKDLLRRAVNGMHGIEEEIDEGAMVAEED